MKAPFLSLTACAFLCLSFENFFIAQISDSEMVERRLDEEKYKDLEREQQQNEYKSEAEIRAAQQTGRIQAEQQVKKEHKRVQKRSRGSSKR